MADLALYRKYRPARFNHLMGQNHVQKTILNAIKSGHLSHAYLFCGPRGTGKTSTARLVAKAINCITPDPEGESCNQCDYCLMMNQGSLVDLIEIDAASNRGIDEIRDLREKIRFAPNQAPHKVYIIDEVHMLTTPAFNALLKTLEEPPPHAYFILATTEIHKVPDTIISRCQRFDFRRIDQETLVDRLRYISQQENVEAEEAALELISRSSQGGMRDAISLFEQTLREGKLHLSVVQEVLGLVGNEGAIHLFSALEQKETSLALSEIQKLHEEGHNLYQFNREFLEFLRARLLEDLEKPEKVAQRLYWIDLFQKASVELKNTLIPQLPLEIAAIKACFWGQEQKNESWFSGLWQHKKEEPAPVTAPSSVSAGPSPLRHVASTSSDALPAPQEEGLKQVPQEGPSLADIKTNLPRVIEKIVTPSIRQSLNTALLHGLNKNVVQFQFQSKFHLEKVSSNTGKMEIESALETVFGAKLKVECDMSQVDNLLNKTLEIFGGELIE